MWFLDLKSGSGSAGQGEPPIKADVVMTLDSNDFTKMFAGEPYADIKLESWLRLWRISLRTMK